MDAASSMDEFCRCCRKVIERKCKFYVKLFGEKAIREGIPEAVRKYGDINLLEEDIGILSTSICWSCYLLVKGIMEKTAKFYQLCHNEERDSAPELKRSVADRSPSQTAVSPSVQVPELKRRILDTSRTRVSLFQTILPKVVDSADNSPDIEVQVHVNRNRF